MATTFQGAEQLRGTSSPPGLSARTSSHPRRPSAPPRALHRIVTFVSAVSLLGLAFNAWGAIVPIPAVGAVSVAAFAVLLLCASGTWVVRSAVALRRIDYAIVATALALLMATVVSNLYFNPGYGTDEAAFVQYAAQMLLHGHNPYGHDLIRALSVYRVPVQYATAMLNGKTVSTLGYPDLSVLLVTAALWLTHSGQATVIVCVVGLGVSLLLAFCLLPRDLAPLAVLVSLGVPILEGYAEAGVISIMMLPFLMLAVARWTATGSNGRLSRADAGRAICLGLAVSIQQLSWFVAPFLLLGIYLALSHQHGRRVAAHLATRFGLVAAATFALVNAPFIVDSPAAWLHGVLAPIVQHAIPYGQGLVDLAIFFHLGGGDLSAYSSAAILVYLTLLATFMHWFKHLWRVALILPVLALLFPTRSLAEYFMTLISVWCVAACTTELKDAFAQARPIAAVESTRRSHLRRRLGSAVVAAGALVSTVFCGVAVASPQPLQMRILSMTTNGQLQAIWHTAIKVTNTSDHALRPHFAPNYMGQQTTYWNVVGGPRTLGAHSSAVYDLAAPNLGSMPGITTPLEFQAVTATPETISSTRRFVPSPYAAYITPPWVNRVLTAGQSITLRVRLRSPFGSDVARAGVRVALAQLIYAQNAEIPGEAQINAGNVGESPVTSLTNANGIATFHVSDRFDLSQPVYFQAWIGPPNSYPFGYSEIVSVLWR